MAGILGIPTKQEDVNETEDEFEACARSMVRNAVQKALEAPESSDRGYLDPEAFSELLVDDLGVWLRGVVSAAFDNQVMVMPGIGEQWTTR